MPTYKVTDPTTGRTLRLTGDSPPTESELSELFAQQSTAAAQSVAAVAPDAERPSQLQDIAQGVVNPFLQTGQRYLAANERMKELPYGLGAIPGVGPGLALAKSWGEDLGLIDKRVPTEAEQNIGRYVKAPETVAGRVAQVPSSLLALAPEFVAGGMAAAPVKSIGLLRNSPRLANVAQSAATFGGQAGVAEGPKAVPGASLSGAVAGGAGALTGGMSPTAQRIATGLTMGGMSAAHGATPEEAATMGIMAGALHSPTSPTVADLNKKIAKTIQYGIDKGIKPSVKNKINPKGIEEIVANKDAIKLTDTEGEPVPGGLPKTARQTEQAMDQTMKSLVSEWQEMSKAATGKDVIIDTSSVVNELVKVASDPVLRAANRSAANYAMRRARELGKYDEDGNLVGQQFTPVQLEEIIKTVNGNLKAYYSREPNASVKNADVEHLAMNRLRMVLDDAISSTEGPGYKDLKQRYGSVASMEKEVRHRALVDAKKNPQGLISSLANVASAGELVAALATGNPAPLVRVAGYQGAKAALNYVNDPNTQLKRMFSKTDKFMQQRSRLVRDAAPAPIETVTPMPAAEITPAAELPTPRAPGELVRPETPLVSGAIPSQNASAPVTTADVERIVATALKEKDAATEAAPVRPAGGGDAGVEVAGEGRGLAGVASRSRESAAGGAGLAPEVGVSTDAGAVAAGTGEVAPKISTPAEPPPVPPPTPIGKPITKRTKTGKRIRVQPLSDGTFEVLE